MPDLDYAKVIQRLGLNIGDGTADPDDQPDTIWCDEGRIRIIPDTKETYVKVIDGTPVPWTGGNAVIECLVSQDTDDAAPNYYEGGSGYLLYGGKPFVWVVDLTSDKVNPRITEGATHQVQYLGVKADGTDVPFPNISVRITAAGDGVSDPGVNDLTVLAPANPGSSTPIVVGPRGDSVAAVSIDPVTGALVFTLDDPAATELDAGPIPVTEAATTAAATATTKASEAEGSKTDAETAAATATTKAGEATTAAGTATTKAGEASASAASASVFAVAAADALEDLVSQKGSASGIAPLGADSKLPETHVPDRLSAASLTASIDQTAAANVTDVGTDLGAALVAPSSPVVQRSLKTTFYDSFADKPDGAVLAGDLSDSGHPYSLRVGGAGGGFAVAGGYLTHTQANTASNSAAYLGVDLGEKASKLGCRFIAPAGADTPETLTLIISKYPFTTATSDGGPTPGGTGFPVAAAHCNFTPTQILYETLDYPFDGRDIQRKYHAEWERDKPYVADVEILGNRACITLRGDFEGAPEPIQIVTKADPKIYNQGGNHLCFELYLGTGAKTELLITDIWGEAASRNGIGAPAASRVEAAAASRQKGRMLYHYDTEGANVATDILTTMTTLITTPAGFEVPADVDAVIIQAGVWINKLLPTTQVATSLRIRTCIANDTYGKERTVLSGWTPANTTGAAITDGGIIITESKPIDISALYEGDRLSVLIKAAAGDATHYDFINSGDGSGGASTLRGSWVRVYAAVS